MPMIETDFQTNQRGNKMDASNKPSTLADLLARLIAIRDHAERVRDAAKKSAEQLAGPGPERTMVSDGYKGDLPGMVAKLMQVAEDIDDVLVECDDYQQSVEVLTGAWEEKHKPGSRESLEHDIRETVASLPKAPKLEAISP